MDITAIKSQIKTGNFDNYYIFTGPEIKVMDIYIEHIARVKNASIVYMESVQQLMQKLKNSTLLKNAQICVFSECNEFLYEEKLQRRIFDITEQNNTIVVFKFNTIDKRSKFYKNYADKIVTFDYMKEPVLIKYIQNEIDLSEPFCKDLINCCENDYSRILLEIDKLKQFVSVHKCSFDSAYKIFIDENIIYRPPADAVFDFVDAVLRRNKKLAISLLKESYACGEATLVILTNLYNAAKQLYQVQSYDGDNLSNATGLTPFQIKLAKGRLNKNSLADLKQLMIMTRNAERGIKIGSIDESNAVLTTLIKFWEI